MIFQHVGGTRGDQRRENLVELRGAVRGEFGWVVTTDKIKVPLTSTIASQNHKKILNRGFACDSAAHGISWQNIDISYIADGTNAVAAVRSGAELFAQIADVHVKLRSKDTSSRRERL